LHGGIGNLAEQSACVPEQLLELGRALFLGWHLVSKAPAADPQLIEDSGDSLRKQKAPKSVMF
jgi:hypothetical protein